MTRPPRVLMLGVDVPMLEAATRLGVSCLVVQGSSNRDFGQSKVPGDHAVVFAADTADIEHVWSTVVRATGSHLNFDAVVTTDELSVVPASFLGHALGVRSIDPFIALGYRDKAEQKRRIKSAGLATSNFLIIDDIAQGPPDLVMPEQGVVVKPVAGGATEFTVHVKTTSELNNAFRRLADTHGCPRTMMIEDYAAGQEWMIDGIVVNGAVRYLTATRYGESCLDALTNSRPVRTLKVDPQTEPLAFARIAPFVDKCLTAIGPFDGAFSMELFVTENEVLFGECAARRGGGLVQEETQIKFGVDLAECSLLAALGQLGTIQPKPIPDAVGSTFLPCLPGTILRAPSRLEIERLPGVALARIELPIGFNMPVTSNTVYKLGAACVTAETNELLAARLDAVVDWTGRRTVVGPVGATGAILRQLALEVSDLRK